MRSILTLLAGLAFGDFNQGIHLNEFAPKRIEDKSTDPHNPYIKIWFQPDMLYSAGSLWGGFRELDLKVRDKVCNAKPWHLWIGITGTDDQADKMIFDEWWPTICKLPSTPNKRNPIWNDNTFPNVTKFHLPPKVADLRQKDRWFVIRADLKTYEPGQNMVCKEKYHFHIANPASDAEGTAEINELNPRRPTAPYKMPDSIKGLFSNDIDLCTMIRHPCWCERAPPELGCKLCQMHENFDNQWLCYGDKHDENRKWCDAVTVERIEGEPNRPIDTFEYEELLTMKQLGDPQLSERNIVWV